MAEDYGEADDSDDRENRAKAELRSVISKQFKLRKGSDRTDDNKKEEEERAVLYAKVYGFLFFPIFLPRLKICCINRYTNNTPRSDIFFSGSPTLPSLVLRLYT